MSKNRTDVSYHFVMLPIAVKIFRHCFRLLGRLYKFGNISQIQIYIQNNYVIYISFCSFWKFKPYFICFRIIHHL